jgi:hypothetical protein
MSAARRLFFLASGAFGDDRRKRLAPTLNALFYARSRKSHETGREVKSGVSSFPS